MVIEKKLSEFLKSYNFKEDTFGKKEVLKRKLYGGCNIIIRIEDFCDDNEPHEAWLGIDLIHSSFAKSLVALYQENYNEAIEYYSKPKPMEWDSRYLGIVGDIFLPFNISGAIEQKKDLSWGVLGERMQLFEFLEYLDLIIDDQSCFDVIFKTCLGEFLSLNDSMWLFLYLVKKKNFTLERAICELNRPYMQRFKRMSNFKKTIDIEICKKYFDLIESIQKISCT